MDYGNRHSHGLMDSKGLILCTRNSGLYVPFFLAPAKIWWPLATCWKGPVLDKPAHLSNHCLLYLGWDSWFFRWDLSPNISYGSKFRCQLNRLLVESLIWHSILAKILILSITSWYPFVSAWFQSRWNHLWCGRCKWPLHGAKRIYLNYTVSLYLRS